MLEQESGNNSIQIQAPTVLKGLFTQLENPTRWLARTIMRPLFKAGDRMIEYKHLEESLAELDNMLDQHSLLAVVISHISHADILPGIELVRAIRSRSPQFGNFYISIAASLVRGQQGPMARLFYSEGALPLLEQSNIKPLALVTKNDQKKRHLTPTFSEIKQLNRAAQETDSAFLNFAEGSVEGGRRDVLGNVRGLQEVTNGFLPYVFQKAQEAGRKVVVLPVGISGTNRILSAENIFLTWRVIGALVQDWVFRKPAVLARATVGQPYEYYPNESGVALTKTSQEVNDTVMASIAQLKPLREKGYYDPATRRYQQTIKEFERKHGKIYLFLMRSRLLPLPNVLKQPAEEYSKLASH